MLTDTSQCWKSWNRFLTLFICQATTPVDPRVLDAMLPYLTDQYGNPHSRTHAYGWEAEKAVEDARAVSTLFCIFPATNRLLGDGGTRGVPCSHTRCLPVRSFPWHCTLARRLPLTRLCVVVFCWTTGWLLAALPTKAGSFTIYIIYYHSY